MQITPSQSTLQAFGSSITASTPSATARPPVVAEAAERPSPQVTQTAQAAPRAEPPARPDADAQTPASEAASRRPGARLDIVV